MTKNSGKPTQPFLRSLEAFADSLAAKFSVQASFNPEDQLKSPVDVLLKAAAGTLGFQVEVITEVQEKALAGRPDIGVARKGLLAGYIELKAPGKGADPTRLKGADKAQWNKFKDLPNLIYTDSNEWTLYRSGERVGRIVRLSGDIISDGASAIAVGDDAALLGLLRDFFNWNPIVPSSPRALAELLAPLCRLLQTEVTDALKNPASNLSSLAVDWRKYLFPDADDGQFADAYAQTLTYALLLARLSGGSVLTADEAVKTIRKEHRLLSESLKLLADNAAREEIKVPVELLERVIAEVDVAALAKKSGGDPWLYFYEDFLAAYDPKMRKDRGVYYTPVPVVHAQVRLVAELLQTHFGARYSFVDEKVVTLDPATGTGTYIVAALTHGLDQIEADKGKGLRAQAATTGARNIHAFEVLVGPYAVAHLRLTQKIIAEGGEIPADGIHIYLTDTLEPPHAAPPGHLPMAYRSLGEEHKRAQKIKANTPVLVCIGNPPYDRQTMSDEERVNEQAARKGGWIRYGDERKEGTGILQDFITPLSTLNAGLHAKNPPGKARCRHGTPGGTAHYPNVFSYDPAKDELYIGEGAQRGVFDNVSKEIWEFSISGFEVVKSWLGYRMKDRKGKSSSPLDKIRPSHWVFDEELLNLIWLLEHTLALYPAVEHWLNQIAAGALLATTDLPTPAPAERQRLPARVLARETQDMF